MVSDSPSNTNCSNVGEAKRLPQGLRTLEANMPTNRNDQPKPTGALSAQTSFAECRNPNLNLNEGLRAGYGGYALYIFGGDVERLS